MYEQIEKPKGNQSSAVANSVTQKKSNGKQGFGFVDNRECPIQGMWRSRQPKWVRDAQQQQQGTSWDENKAMANAQRNKDKVVTGLESKAEPLIAFYKGIQEIRGNKKAYDRMQEFLNAPSAGKEHLRTTPVARHLFTEASGFGDTVGAPENPAMLPSSPIGVAFATLAPMALELSIDQFKSQMYKHPIQTAKTIINATKFLGRLSNEDGPKWD